MIYTKNGAYFVRANTGGNKKAMQTLSDMSFFQREFGVQLFKKRDNSFSKERMETSLRRSRSNILKVLRANLDDRSYFLTLTFAENMQDYEKANRLFNYWVRVKNNGLKYLLIKELQQRGAIHYHMIIFDCDNALEVSDSWTHGRKHLKHINNKYSWSIANYLTKYFDSEKNQLVHANKKIYSTSRNLLKPLRVDMMFLQYMKKTYYNNDNTIRYEDYEIDKFMNSTTLAKAYFGDIVVIK